MWLFLRRFPGCSKRKPLLSTETKWKFFLRVCPENALLGKYHSRDIHQWVSEHGEQEGCGFHPLLVCSYGKCSNKGGSETVTDQRGTSNNDEVSEDSEVDDRESDESEVGGSESEDGTEGSEEGSNNSGDKSDGKGLLHQTTLTFKLLSLLYEMNVTEKAGEVSHEDMGRGHSNWLRASSMSS